MSVCSSRKATTSSSTGRAYSEETNRVRRGTVNTRKDRSLYCRGLFVRASSRLSPGVERGRAVASWLSPAVRVLRSRASSSRRTVRATGEPGRV